MMHEYVLADFSTAGGTVATSVHSGTSAMPESPVAVWVRSEQARRYEGRFVLLSDSQVPLDSDLSPSALADRHQQLPAGSTLVFVPATRIRLGA
jgi:hypothetical protein